MRYFIAIAAVVVVLVSLVGIKGAQIAKLVAFGKQMEKDGPPPEVVATFVAEDQSWESTLSTVGSVASGKGVALSTDMPGVVTRISFESGATVKQGQILVELDTSVERAQLATALARKELAAANAGRTRALAGKGVLSQAQIDADESQLRTATTDVEGIQAQIAKKTIRAPFAGKLGIRSVNLGQFLNPGTPVTTLETVESMHVDFSLPQQKLADVAVGMLVRITSDTDGGAPVEAKVGAVDPSIDSVTRSIKLRADIDDQASDALRNGMFVKVAVILPQKADVVAVPATAVIRAPYGDSVFVVEDKKPESGGLTSTPDGKPVKTARQQFVKLGASRGDFVAIVDGIKTKQEIVVAGGFKLKNNTPVVVDNAKSIAPKLDPRPENR
ncbi:MAG TPA: efflux RND transporter periplasmic adaptor subunit [Labilithrix sp.]|nr:efflux RND transporter periplasmic adaptor subunit [Labilithrix sp.]